MTKREIDTLKKLLTVNAVVIVVAIAKNIVKKELGIGEVNEIITEPISELIDEFNRGYEIVKRLENSEIVL